MIEAEPTLGPPGTRKILVVSHERSGTHFLMNTLAANFGYTSDPWADIDDDRVVNPYAAENIKSYLSQFEGVPMLNLFKTHFEAGFFTEILDWLLDEFTVFYIKRRTLDVMKSLQRLIDGLPWKAGPKGPGPRDGYGFSEPCGQLLRYQLRQHSSLFVRHHEHIAGWESEISQEQKNQIIYVRYENLNERFEAEVQRISECLGLPMISRLPVRPDRAQSVIMPNKEKADAA